MRTKRLDQNAVKCLLRAQNALQDPARGMGASDFDLPNGKQAETLAEVSASTGMDQKVSALAVLQAKDMPEHLVAEAKDVYASSGTAKPTRLGVGVVVTRRSRILERIGAIQARADRKKKRKRREPMIKALHGQPESDFDGLAVMLRVEGFDPWPGGLTREQLHVTVAYYGNSEDVDDETKAEWENRLTQAFRNHPVMRARVGGITRFTNDSEDGQDPVVASVSCKELEALRQQVIELTGPPNSDHGFTPHMTLGYIDKEDSLPIQRQPTTPITLDALIIGFGRDTTVIPFKEEEANVHEDS